MARDAPGGIETFIAQLVPALQALGCKITLLASGDSRTTADLIPVVPTNLRQQMAAGTAGEYGFYEQHQLHLAVANASGFDVVHSHIGWGGYTLSAVPMLGDRVLHTVHSPVYLDLEWFVQQHPHVWFSTVSEFQAGKLRLNGASRCHAVHNGINIADFTFEAKSRQELLFVGRMEWGKGPDAAVEVARTLGLPLSLAGPIVEHRYFEQVIKPVLGEQIRYVGEVDHSGKNKLFGEAGCVLMPSRRDEPFGMVSVEAMACGTPVVSLASGALPEIIEPGVTGFTTREEHTLAPLVLRALTLDRTTVRQRAAARFDIPVVAAQYLEVYEAERRRSDGSVQDSASVGVDHD